MSQQPPPPQPQPQPGWYPLDGDERWWDGSSWSEVIRPAQAAIQGQPTALRATHTTRNVLLGVGLVLVLLLGGCGALIAVVVHSSNRHVADLPPDHGQSSTIVEGQPFVKGDFDYAAGWSIGTDEFGDATATGLEATNNSDDTAIAIVEIDLRAGAVQVAEIDCAGRSDGVTDPGQSVALHCVSSDTLPATYDEVTITD